MQGDACLCGVAHAECQEAEGDPLDVGEAPAEEDA